MKSLAQMYKTIIGRPSTSADQAAADAAAKEIVSSQYVLEGQPYRRDGQLLRYPDRTITISAPQAIMKSLREGETEDDGYGGQAPKYFVNNYTGEVQKNQMFA